MTVQYDLAAPKGDKYKTVLILRKDSDKGYSYLPRDVEGDIGSGTLPGQNRVIRWDTNEEFPQGIVGNDYYFEITAEKIAKQSFSVPWIGIGLAALAGTAALWYGSSLSGSQTFPNTPAAFPAPPGRPH
ncbi:MAG: hypothetical protein ACHQQQ_02365 [Bacteroidota bacterium]